MRSDVEYVGKRVTRIYMGRGGGKGAKRRDGAV